MTPYDLERARDRLKDALEQENAPDPLIEAIASAQHLANVEGDLNIGRANANG